MGGAEGTGGADNLGYDMINNLDVDVALNHRRGHARDLAKGVRMKRIEESSHRTLICVAVALALVLPAQRVGAQGAGMAMPASAPAAASADEAKATRDVTIKSGGQSRTFTLAELQGFPKVSLARYSVIGAKMGLIGPYTWVGASLIEVLTRVDPTIANPSHKGSEILVTSSDNWKVRLLWEELFAAVPRGAALYNIKGCNECHGIRGEGTAPAGKKAAPALAGRTLALDAVLTQMRAGGDAHGGINPYPESQLARGELQAILDYYSGSKAAAADTFVPPSERRSVLLAYEKEGQPATGKDGLIQLIVGPDEAASRYSHWVKTIEVVPAAR